MKSFIIVLTLTLFVSCGKNSSPEGRMTIKLEKIQIELDSIKQQQAALSDSMLLLKQELKSLKIKFAP